VNGKGIEVTTLRLDLATDGRHAEVAFTDDWQADASRRDFTFNALSLDQTGVVHDYFGGQQDLAAGLVRFVGEADARVREDYLRILRFFRFFAWYGVGEPDAAALSACEAGRNGLAQLSAERIRVELLKLLGAPDPLPAAKAMAEAGVLQGLLGADAPDALAKLISVEGAVDPLLRLAALAPGDATEMKALGEKLRLSNAERRSLSDLAKPWNDLDAEPSAMLYRMGADRYRRRALLAFAVQGKPLAGKLAAADAWTSKTFPLAGRDLLALGVPKGPAVGVLHSSLEAWWIDCGFRPSKTDILREAEARLSGASGEGK
jgi:poly(A) polymerase